MKHSRRIKKPLFSVKEVIFLVVSTCIFSFAMAAFVFGHKTSKVKYVEDSNLSLFLEQYDYIINNYYDKVDKKKLIDGAIVGMLYSLGDPYAEYYDQSSSNNFNARLNGAFDGIGVQVIQLNDGSQYVLDVYEGSSAYENGVRPGDIIIEINNKDITSMSTTEFLSIIRNSNEPIKIKVLRNDEKIDFELTKSRVVLKSVSSKIVDNVGYIKVNIFAINTYEQFKTALDNLATNNIEGLIIDLRDNPGGHLTTAEKILALLINKDKVIYQIDNQGKQEKYYSKGAKDYKLPLVVLINNDSASASELVSSALSEQLGAILIGKTTYGKGTVQELITLPDGGQYKITTKQWLTSKGNKLEGVGVVPTIELNDEDDDSYINKAIGQIKLKKQEN